MNSSALLWIAIPAISCALYALLFYIGGQRSQHEIQWFSVFLLVGAFWSLTSMILHAGPSFVPLLVVNRFAVLGNFAIPLTILGFTIQFLSLRRLHWWLWSAIVGYAGVVVLNLLGLIVTRVEVNHGLIDIQYGWGIWVAGVFWALCIYSSAFFLIRELRATKDAMFRKRVIYILVVLFLLLVGNILNATSLVQYPVDLFLAMVAAVLISLSISRYQFLEIQRTLRGVMVKMLLIGLYIAGITGAIYLLAHLGQTVLLPISVGTAVITGGILYAYPPARRAINTVIERLFLPNLYDVQQVIYAISRMGNRLTLPSQLGSDLLQEFERALQFESGALLIKPQADAPYSVIATRGLPFSTHQITFQADSPLIKELTEHRLAMHVDRLQELPRMRALWTEEWEALGSLRTQILLPVVSQTELIGFFVFGPRQGKSPYAREELQRTLPTLANQVSIALANSRLYAQEQARADALARANEELQQLARMKDELVQNVSHELRTPLTIIQGYAELLVENGISSPEDTHMAAQKVLQQARHLNHLVNQLLMFQRMARSGIALSPLPIATWLADVATLWGTTLTDTQLQLCLDIDPTVGQVQANEDYLRQVVDNLLDNARKFSPQGGRVYLRAWQEGQDVYVAVADQGIGVSPESLPRLFERFYQVDGGTSRRFGGMGLGLALCYEIITCHGGKIWAESAGKGQGLTVTFSLPATGGEPPLTMPIEPHKIDNHRYLNTPQVVL